MIKGVTQSWTHLESTQNHSEPSGSPIPKTSNWSGTLFWTHVTMKRLYAFHLAEARYYKKMVQSEFMQNSFGGILCNGYPRALCSRKYRNHNFISWDFGHEFCTIHLKNCIDFIKNGEKSNRNWKEIIFQGFPRYSKIA